MNITFRVSIIKSVGGIEIGFIVTDYPVLRGRFPQRGNRYVGSAVGVNPYSTPDVVIFPVRKSSPLHPIISFMEPAADLNISCCHVEICEHFVATQVSKSLRSTNILK